MNPRLSGHYRVSVFGSNSAVWWQSSWETIKTRWPRARSGRQATVAHRAVRPFAQRAAGSGDLLYRRVVRPEGLEPPCLAALGPKPSASANSATTALAILTTEIEPAPNQTAARSLVFGFLGQDLRILGGRFSAAFRGFPSGLGPHHVDRRSIQSVFDV